MNIPRNTVVNIMNDQETCPKCGSLLRFKYNTVVGFLCGTQSSFNTLNFESSACIARQRDQLQKELSSIKEAWQRMGDKVAVVHEISKLAKLL